MADGIFEFTDANFRAEVLNSERPVLVDFWATWCGPCKAIAPVISDLAKDFEGKVKVGKLDIDNQQAVAQQYKIMSIPTLLVFKGGQVVDTIVGAKPKAVIEGVLRQHV